MSNQKTNKIIFSGCLTKLYKHSILKFIKKYYAYNRNMNDPFELENFQTLTRNEQTKIDYLKRAEQLIKKAKKQLDMPQDEELDVRQLVVWLNEHKVNIARTTWRQYKSAVIYYLENHSDILAADEALEYIRDITSIGALIHTERTSSLKMKKISYEDWEKLDGYLKEKNKKWHEQLRFWLRASIITGLRPVEWKNAVFTQYENEPALKVQNAKNTNRRSHGENRTLILKNVKPEDLNAIRSHLNNIRTFSGMDAYEFFYNGCAIALYKACRKCWPRRKRHITLYSTRHQFSANAKSSGFSRAEVAALMGHAVDITATIHYGRKQAGNETLSINPTDEDVSRVREIDVEDFKTRINKKQDNLL